MVSSLRRTGHRPIRQHAAATPRRRRGGRPVSPNQVARVGGWFVSGSSCGPVAGRPAGRARDRQLRHRPVPAARAGVRDPGGRAGRRDRRTGGRGRRPARVRRASARRPARPPVRSAVRRRPGPGRAGHRRVDLPGRPRRRRCVRGDGAAGGGDPAVLLLGVRDGRRRQHRGVEGTPLRAGRDGPRRRLRARQPGRGRLARDGRHAGRCPGWSGSTR